MKPAVLPSGNSSRLQCQPPVLINRGRSHFSFLSKTLAIRPRVMMTSRLELLSLTESSFLYTDGRSVPSSCQQGTAHQ